MDTPLTGPGSRTVRRRDLLPAGLLVVLIGTQIAYPLTDDTARDAVTVAVVLLSAGTALLHAAVTRGIRYAAGFAVIVSGIGLLAEAVGTATGIPFGAYDYADGRIGPELFGVPLAVPLAWTGGLYPIWVVAGLVCPVAAARIAATAVSAVGWDLFLDPQMVADGQWRWVATDSGLPGIAEIPWTNYLGWLGVATVMAVALTVWERSAARSERIGVPVLMFLWTWLGSALAHAVFLGLPYSAVYGGLVLGILGVALLVRLVRDAADRATGHDRRTVGPVAWRG
ncbi:carotenoid biosynthesis protein [Nocardia sp. NBC_01329]|uniref:carotenoid biosynthesis protein n=1 Tax=Nocardia sp. NBC_01329 TaxID=2903594 RepID=UPI002E125230|nr:carotenoid biosynthesis protein [Nocardia sp. NBC_01329]